MTKTKVLTSFSNGKFTDLEISDKGDFIVYKMTGNEYFPNPEPTLIKVSSVIADYKNAYTKAQDGTKADTVAKNNLRIALEAILKDLGDYVQRTSNGDEVMILSSGFDVNKKPANIGPLDKVTGVKITMGNNKGSIEISWDVVPNADYYEIAYTKSPVTPTSVWLKETSKKRKRLIENLTRGEELTFQVTAVGSDPSRSWSDDITTFIA
jgi:hypothetical protein